MTITYIGEGSSNQGDFHEGLNFAGIHRCRSSTSSRTTATRSRVPMALQSAVKDIAVRGAGYNMPGIVVDGDDVLECYRVGQ